MTAALAPFERAAADGEAPYAIQHELQGMMQDLVGIVRDEGEMKHALDEHREAAGARAARVGVSGNREYNPGWHTALDLRNLLTVSRGDHARGASSGRRAAARTSARIIPEKDAECGEVQHRGAEGRRDGAMQLERACRSRRCRRSSRRSSRR